MFFVVVFVVPLSFRFIFPFSLETTVTRLLLHLYVFTNRGHSSSFHGKVFASFAFLQRTTDSLIFDHKAHASFANGCFILISSNFEFPFSSVGFVSFEFLISAVYIFEIFFSGQSIVYAMYFSSNYFYIITSYIFKIVVTCYSLSKMAYSHNIPSQQTPSNIYIIVNCNFPLNNITVTCYITVI